MLDNNLSRLGESRGKFVDECFGFREGFKRAAEEMFLTVGGGYIEGDFKGVADFEFVCVEEFVVGFTLLGGAFAVHVSFGDFCGGDFSSVAVEIFSAVAFVVAEADFAFGVDVYD